MAKRSCLAALALLFLLLCVPRSRGGEDEAYIGGVRLSRGARGDLLLEFRVQNALNSRIYDTLDSGLPVRFTYWIRVEHPRKLARDETLVDLKLVRVLEKDNLKDRYRVTLEEEADGRDLDSLEEAVEVMTRVEGVSLAPLQALWSRKPLFLRIKAQLQKFQLPFRLHYLFAFVSYWDVETDWYSLELPWDLQALR